MSHIRVIVCRVDDPTWDQMTELAAFDVPATDVTALRPKTTLDELEMTTHQRECEIDWLSLKDCASNSHCVW